jgi:transcriptional regulator with XRE-family HTH domain
MTIRERFGRGLQHARKRLQLTQEDFSTVSSRTYLSSLERGIKSPTIDKLEQLASVLGVHPVALLAMAYISDEGEDADKLFDRVRADLRTMVGDQ